MFILILNENKQTILSMVLESKMGYSLIYKKLLIFMLSGIFLIKSGLLNIENAALEFIAP